MTSVAGLLYPKRKVLEEKGQVHPAGWTFIRSGDHPPPFEPMQHPHARKRYSGDRNGQRRDCDPRGQILGFHVFLEIIQEQDVDQVDAERASADLVYDPLCFL